MMERQSVKTLQPGEIILLKGLTTSYITISLIPSPSLYHHIWLPLLLEMFITNLFLFIRGSIWIHSILIHSDPFQPIQIHSNPFRSIPTHSDPFQPIQIHSNPFRSTLILVLSFLFPFATQSKTVACFSVHSLILLFDHLCHSAFGQAELYARNIYSLSYWVKGFLGVFSLDLPSSGMSKWCT